MSRILSMACAALAISFAALVLAAEPAPAQTKTGIIKSVDAKASTFVLTLPARPLTFTLNPKTEITLDGKPSNFEAAIKPDLNATVTYTRSGEDRLASKVEVKAAAAK